MSTVSSVEVKSVMRSTVPLAPAASTKWPVEKGRKMMSSTPDAKFCLSEASLGLMPFGAALWAGVWITVVFLGLFAWLAARRLPVLNGQRAALVLVLLALGALVVAVKTLAH